MQNAQKKLSNKNKSKSKHKIQLVSTYKVILVGN